MQRLLCAGAARLDIPSPTISQGTHQTKATPEAVELYSAGYSLNAISLKLGIAWDSVARLLDRAGVRERKNKSR